ncbi:bifunctional aminoglycoside phosphotransferase/ATP-binding protein [Hydrogenophaga sp.]|uniref:bifunctional aminoglycoside phosphotransferase/ATP-binding protein n=1 Tax=Hydrogenophaga sp. TaxID=1904254 RepID=UPI0027305BBB|nr:bifunctional aminoglycoside phosphotransferase/ATP-binding protein [Hydrogenophaga sp.]MDP1684156.1 AAA family ATPase [Hydrogenophaga sp.]
MAPALPGLIKALRDPACCPQAEAPVELMETHGAWVLLAGVHAWKIKKPVCLPFMDFGTLALRRAACQAEVGLNRRFETADPATHLYLDALPIVGTADQPRWGTPGEDDDRAIEWAVHMRRFDEDQRLDHLCARGALTPEHLGSFARRMALFQSRAAVAAPGGPWGRANDVLAFARDNLTTLHSGLTDVLEAAQIDELSRWTESRLAQLAPLLTQRLGEGRVREGHGDLHLANLVLIGNEVVPFDGIEFNDALRWIDVASDMAFAWMDLLEHGQPGLANGLLSDWLDASGDTTAPEVLPFFAVYRALVRAKVAVIRSGQAGADVDASLLEARSHTALAQRISQPPAPQLVITHGLSGSGKTWASSRWLQAEASGRAIRLRSDVERKRLHGLSAKQASGSGLNTGLYSPQAHTDTYAHLLERAGKLLREGWSVLVDAAFLRRHEREAFAALANTVGCPFHILATEAPLAVLRERITERQARGADASEATVAVLEQQLGWLEPLTPDERARCLPMTV